MRPSLTRLQVAFCLCVIVCAIANPHICAQSIPPTKIAPAKDYGKLPLSFEANQGQVDPQVRFLSRGNGYSLFLTDKEAVLSLRKAGKTTPSLRSPHEKLLAKQRPSYTSDVVRMQLAGASPAMRISAADQLPGTSNYFIGNDRSRWHSNIPTFAKVRYEDVYRGVDLVYYGNQQQLEYDFIVKPGADTRSIRLHFAGAKKLKLAPNGDLEILAPNGQLAFHKPVLYQQIDGKRRIVNGSFKLLARNQASFEVGAYDRTRNLVIDPTLAYSTYLGGYYGSGIYDVAVDRGGNAYVVGQANQMDFPGTAGPIGLNSYEDISFIAKINSTGTALLYSTLCDEYISAIAVDSSGDAYLTGQAGSTYSTAATPNAFQTTNDGKGAFAAELNPTGTALLYLTYLGGSNGMTHVNYGALGESVAIDDSGNAYVAGAATGPYFPVTPGAFQTTNNAVVSPYGVALDNAFVAKIDTTGSQLIYSTLIGGYGTSASRIAIDASGDAFVTGSAGSYNGDGFVIPFRTTPGAFDRGQTIGGTTNVVMDYGSFVAKIDPTGSSLLYSTYLGDTVANAKGGDQVNNPTAGGPGYISGLAIDADGNAFLTGYVFADNFRVTPGALKTSYTFSQTSSSNGFVTKLNAAGSALVYSTFLGGSTGFNAGVMDFAGSIAVDPLGDAYIVGLAGSTNFPVTSDAFQKSNAGAGKSTNAFFSELNPTGTALIYSTYLGGGKLLENSLGDGSPAIALDGLGGVYVAGTAGTSDFPVTPGAFQTTAVGNPINSNTAAGDGFVAKFELTGPNNSIPSALTAPTPSSTLTGSTATFTWTPGTGVSAWQIDIGSTLNGHQYNPAAPQTTIGYTATDLPTDGSTIYVRLCSIMKSGSQCKFYTYTAFEGLRSRPPSPVPHGAAL